METRSRQGREMYELGLRLGGLGEVAIGSAGGSLARALARCVGCGVALAGGEARFHDGSCAACGVWLGRYYNLPASVFLCQSGGDVRLWITDGRGRELQPPPAGTETPCTGSWDAFTGTDCGWAARRAGGRRMAAVVACAGPAALKLLLERLGCDVLDRPRPGVPLLIADRDGFSLTVEWDGARLAAPGEDALAAAVRWLSREQAVPAFKIGPI